MSQNQQKTPLVIDGITFPVDLTPAQRAGLKLAGQIITIAVFNAVLAGLAVLDNNTVINWNTVITAVISQGALGLVNALFKYSSAKGDLPLSMLFNVIANSVAKRAPVVQYNAPEQAALQAINSAYAPEPGPEAMTLTTGTAVQPAPVPPAPKPQFIYMPMPAPGTASPNLSTPVISNAPAAPAPYVDHPPMDGVPLSNTLPNIAAVRVQP